MGRSLIPFATFGNMPHCLFSLKISF